MYGCDSQASTYFWPLLRALARSCACVVVCTHVSLFLSWLFLQICITRSLIGPLSWRNAIGLKLPEVLLSCLTKGKPQCLKGGGGGRGQRRESYRRFLESVWRFVQRDLISIGVKSWSLVRSRCVLVTFVYCCNIFCFMYIAHILCV